MTANERATARRITAFHHTCCGTVRWSGNRVCDLCGTRADYFVDGVPIEEVMARLHNEDKPRRPAAPVQPPPAAAVGPAAASPTTPPTTPPGARPHRNHEDDEARAPRPPKPLQAAPWSAIHTMWLGGGIALLLALAATVSAGRGEAPLGLLLFSMAAILVVVLVPIVTTGGTGEAAR